MQNRADRQINALALAKACAAHGARVKTIGHVSGLPARDVLHLFFPDRLSVPRGRSPDSPEWYHTTNLLNRAEASIVTALYGRLRRGGFDAPDALLAAYGQYILVCQPPCRISFDRAFDLIAHTEGRWLTDAPSFAVVACRRCDCEYLAAYGTSARADEQCPFCKLTQRYATDPRLQTAFPARPLLSPPLHEFGMLTLLGLAASG